MHGKHHVAQKSINTTLPRSDSSLSALPLSRFKLTAGAGSDPSRSLTLAVLPPEAASATGDLAGGMFFASIAPAAAGVSTRFILSRNAEDFSNPSSLKSESSRPVASRNRTVG